MTIQSKKSKVLALFLVVLSTSQAYSSSASNTNNHRKAESMSNFVPERIQRNYSQNLKARPEIIIPLLAPRKEEKWASGWHPRFIFENLGSSEQGSIFLTEHSGIKETWIMTKHDLKEMRSEFVRFNPDFICEIEIQVTSVGGDRSKAELMYRYTGLNPHGNSFILHYFTKEKFEAMAADWERELNDYLTTNY